MSIKTVIYARYSSDNQREESIEGQLRECKEYADKHNMTIVHTYIDRALSAKTDDRPEFQKMVSDSSKKQFEVVLVWKLDRFARNRTDSAIHRAVLRRNGVKVVSAKENISEGPEGIILEAILEGMAEYYSAELAVKIKRGQTENALKCRYNGGFVPFGYKVNENKLFELDPMTAPIVREMFERYADGQTVKEISAILNARGVLANSKYKYTNKSSMHNLFKNRRYIGEYRHGDVVQPGGMPALVSEDTFARVQERMNKNRHKPAAKKADEEYILTTKLFCGKCGVMMVGVGGTSKTGKVHHYYKCGNLIYKKSCDKKTVRKDWIENAVVMLTKEYVLNDSMIDQMADGVVALQEKENTVLPLLEKQLKEVEKRISNLLDAVEEGMSNASAKERLDGLEEKKADLEISIAKEKIEKPLLTKEHVVFWISRFKDGDVSDPQFRSGLIDIFVNSIFLYDDKLAITFNYKNNTKTISSSELLSADVGGTTFENVLNIADYRCSHLDASGPPKTQSPCRKVWALCF
ncbi:MAG: recombinase family protein [Christensenellaceae bacterium]|jgi:site-specific DNA recombinase